MTKKYTNKDTPGVTYRRLKCGEKVRSGDYCNSKHNPPDNGWVETSWIGRKIKQDSSVWYYREIK